MFQFGLTLKKHATLFLTGILSRLIPNLDSLDVCEEYLRVLGRKHRCAFWTERDSVDGHCCQIGRVKGPCTWEPFIKDIRTEGGGD